MSEPTICWNFTYRCQTCGETVEVVGGVDSHPHAAEPAVTALVPLPAEGDPHARLLTAKPEP